MCRRVCVQQGICAAGCAVQHLLEVQTVVVDLQEPDALHLLDRPVHAVRVVLLPHQPSQLVRVLGVQLRDELVRCKRLGGGSEPQHRAAGSSVEHGKAWRRRCRL